MIYELKYGKVHKHPLSFVAELPKDNILIAVNKKAKTNYIISQLEITALAEHQRNYVYIIPLIAFGCTYSAVQIKIETLFDEFNVYQLENIKEISNI